MKIYLIRHGRQCSKLCNVNVALSPEGVRQAELVGKRLKNAGIEKVYVSDLIRARETAEAAGAFWNAPEEVRPGLREISFGRMEGLSDEEIAEQFADFRREFAAMETDLPYPGGECAADVVKRSLPVIREITESGIEAAAVVTHGGVIRSLTAHFLGMDLAKWRLLGKDLENCSITELEYRKGEDRVWVERFNDYAHLEPYPELLRINW